ncbi:MAG: right-handed parallel beta-helix repeat-containing protein, partial [Myxococcaceae bacterium]
MRTPAVGLVAVALQLACFGCGEAPLTLPEGYVCQGRIQAGPGAEALQAALARAKPGTCVVAARGTYSAALSVPGGVSLVSEVGSQVEVLGEPSARAAVTLASGANLFGVRVVSAPGIGVLIEGKEAQLSDVLVDGAATFALVAWCEEDCRVGPLVDLHEVELVRSGVGLWAHGASVRMVGGRVAENRSHNLASGYGVVASHGALLELTGTIVETNESLGVLVDGDLGTRAALDQVTVRGNLGRGIWAQGLLGTVQAPMLDLSACTIEGNVLAGIGARASRGIRVRGGRIASTVIGKIYGGAGLLVDVGDGVGLFEATGDV